MKLSFNVLGYEVATVELELDIERDDVEPVAKAKSLIERGVKWMSKKWVGGMVA